MAMPGEDGDMLVHSSTQHPTEVQHLVARALELSGSFGGLRDPAHGRRVRRQGIAGLADRRRRRAAGTAHRAAGEAAARPRRRHGADRQAARFPHRLRCRLRRRGPHPRRRFHAGGALRLFARPVRLPIADRAMFHADNCYYLDNARIVSHRCKTNTVSNTAFRGFGGPQGMMGIECVIDEIARHLSARSAGRAAAQFLRHARRATSRPTT